MRERAKNVDYAETESDSDSRLHAATEKFSKAVVDLDQNLHMLIQRLQPVLRPADTVRSESADAIRSESVILTAAVPKTSPFVAGLAASEDAVRDMSARVRDVLDRIDL